MKNEVKKLNFRKKLIFSIITLLLIFSFLEIISRLVCMVRFRQLGTNISIQGDSRWESHNLLIWGNRPRYLEYDHSSQYNEYGMRVKPGEIQMPKKQANDFWVFLFGGSAMYGIGSTENGDWLKISGVALHDIPHSIDGILEKILQKAMPDKKVRVFNAATASYTIFQSRLNYERLKHLHPDWIISMDGANDPMDLNDNETTYTRCLMHWIKNPVNGFPYLQGRFLMRNSAFMFLIGEYLFFRSGIIRSGKNIRQDKETIEYWLLKNPAGSSVNKTLSHENNRAVNEFLKNLWLFHQTLSYDGQKHLLLIQPHLSMRCPAKLKNTERAVYNYFSRSGGGINPFMKAVYERIPAEFQTVSQIATMDSLHYSDKWIFVDYCHFSGEANGEIAAEISKHILSEGKYKPFQISKESMPPLL